MTGYNIIHSMLILFSFLHRIQASFECPDFNDTEVDSVSKLPILRNTTNAIAEENWTVIAVWF